MTDCCASSGTTPRKHRCPVCAEESLAVSVTTILQHIKTPWQWHAKEQGYYFCSNPGCSVVYFAEDNSFINLSELRTIVGIKAKTKDAPICYCFGVSVDEALHNPDAKAFVIQQTQLHNCACAIRNPSGRCCLKDFPKT